MPICGPRNPPIGQFEGAFEVCGEISAVIFKMGNRSVWKLVRADQVPSPQLEPVDPELACGFVHQSFRRELSFGFARAADRAGGHGVGQNSAGLKIACRHVVD